jgi:hypothetical protein
LIFLYFFKAIESDNNGKVEIKPLYNNEIPQRFILNASVANLHFELYFNQIEGKINDHSSSKVYIINGKDTKETSPGNLVN